MREVKRENSPEGMHPVKRFNEGNLRVAAVR